MSPILEKPILHGRDHCPGGADPIPCMPDLTGADSYPDLILAHPCLVHYWPCDESSGDLIDRVSTWDLTADTAVVASPVSGTFPQYGAVGPLSELPAYTAVVNAGEATGLAADDGRFYYEIGGTAPPYWDGGTDGYTVELWVYLTSYASTGSSYLLHAEGFSNDLGIHVFDNDPGVLVFNGAGVGVIDADAFPLDAWQHIVACYDGSELELYRNGASLGTTAAGDPGIGGTVALLNEHAGGPAWSPANGRLAQVAIYDCALTPAEVASHYGAQDSSGNAPDGYVLTSDGEGGFSWEPAVGGGGASASDTLAWMPLADSDGTLVLDGSDLIPTLIPIT